ncbi:hypothetical protein GCM10009819_29740 [Agromyces tropicus]|uniref:Cupin type-2 domain-containing protein n=1 Tax=Agromyces tropicus TaxID=555371 RepID=A0ABN2URS4_9MICO
MTSLDAASVTAAGSTRSWWCLGARVTVHVRRADTGGLFTLVELQAEPGFRAPRHVHRVEDETLMIRDGALEVQCGDRTWTAEAGACVFLPQRMPHSFAVASRGPLRAWQIIAPAGFEDLLPKLGHPAPRPGLPPPHGWDVPGLVEIAAEHGIDILPWR